MILNCIKIYFVNRQAFFILIYYGLPSVCYRNVVRHCLCYLIIVCVLYG